MRHRERRRFRPETSRSPTRQLVTLCAMLLLALLLMSRAKDPRAWTWLTNLDSAEQPAAESESNDSPNPLLVREELPPGVFVGSAQQAKPPGTGLIQRESETAADSHTPAPPIDRSVFDGIRDKTRQIPPAAYFHLLDVARRESPEELERRAQRRALTFAHFAASPERYRGQPVFLRGHVRRMTEIVPIDNREGFERLYEGWLFTEESQDNPYVIVVSRLPEGFPLGGSIIEDVSCAGYFLKLWAYRAGDGDRYAPLLVGHRVVWHPRPAAASASISWHVVVLAAMAGLIVALCVVTWYARRSAAAVRQLVAAQTGPPAPSEVQAIGEQAAPSTEEYLANLEQHAGERGHENARGD